MADRAFPRLSEPTLGRPASQGPTPADEGQAGLLKACVYQNHLGVLAKNRSEALPAPSENPWERCWSEIELRGCTAEKAAAGQKVLEAWGGLSIVKPAERLSGCEEWIYWFNQQCAMNCVLGTGHRGHHLTSVPTLRGLKVLHR